ncbi:hypothetical protein BRD17_01470 [Halobacteriales archaeon SW_7_68_16]|nr:MAG: hypothetical protein BRD17_01470 [Halobacteriales archaeon SW_7_68_16]
MAAIAGLPAVYDAVVGPGGERIAYYHDRSGRTELHYRTWRPGQSSGGVTATCPMTPGGRRSGAGWDDRLLERRENPVPPRCGSPVIGLQARNAHRSGFLRVYP